MPLGIAGEEHLATSDGFLDLDLLPAHVLFVGGGYIAFEFAHIGRRAGANVTMLEQAPTVLGPFDRDLVGWLVERSRAIGAGRVPALDRLDLDVAGIAHARGRLELNEYLQSVSNPAVYVAGDAAQVGPPLTPVASRDGDVVATNMLEGKRARPRCNNGRPGASQFPVRNLGRVREIRRPSSGRQ
jgi:glutathione reductase (NADPH)